MQVGDECRDAGGVGPVDEDFAGEHVGVTGYAHADQRAKRQAIHRHNANIASAVIDRSDDAVNVQIFRGVFVLDYTSIGKWRFEGICFNLKISFGNCPSFYV